MYAAVEKGARGRGVGQALVNAIEQFTAGHGSNLLSAEVEDSDPASLAFAQKRGYQIRRHGYDSVLDLIRFDPTPFARLVDSVKAGGIRFFTMADDSSDDLKQALYKLYEATFVDGG